MTTQTTIHRSANSILASIRATAAAIFDTVAEASDVARCAREAERLFDLSDAELARLGLTRDGVVQHAFRRYLYV